MLKVDRTLNPNWQTEVTDGGIRRMCEKAARFWAATEHEIALCDELADRYGIETLPTIRTTKDDVDRGRIYRAGEYSDHNADDTALLAYLLRDYHGMAHHTIAFLLKIRPRLSAATVNRGGLVYLRRTPIQALAADLVIQLTEDDEEATESEDGEEEAS